MYITTISHVLYGGAHLFNRNAPAKLNARALAVMDEFGTSDPIAFAALFDIEEEEVVARILTERVRARLATRALESMCIDFEDGFGVRSNEEEDAEAIRAATELSALWASQQVVSPPHVGIRIKALKPRTRVRAARTLDLFVTHLETIPPAFQHTFTVTLPKVEHADEVHALSAMLAKLEAARNLPPSSIGIELMVETPRAVETVAAITLDQPRVRAAHLGAYDLTAELGVTAGDQRLDHPFCDYARMTMKIALANTNVEVVDGATTVLPIAPPKSSSDVARRVIHRAWQRHGTNVTRAIELGIFRGWDLHPAQLPARYGALYAHFLTRREALSERLKNFLEQSMKASRVGHVFDDAATGRGLLSFFRRGVACGALDATDVTKAGLTQAEIDLSFDDVLAGRLVRSP